MPASERDGLPDVPSGTVTFLFTDIEGSTKLLEQLRDDYVTLLADHRDLLRAAFARCHGHEIGTQGDSFFVTFPRALDALNCVIEAQQALARHVWPGGVQVRVRMGLHTGEPIVARTGYVGLDVHRAARVAAAGHGGQVLLSQTTRDLLYQDLPPGVAVRALGEHTLKDIRAPQPLYQLDIAGLPANFPPLKATPAPRAPAIQPDQFADFGQLLSFLRQRAGLTQRELSIAVGYSEAQISRLEQNQRAPDPATLAARFVPALHLEYQPAWVTRLLELASVVPAGDLLAEAGPEGPPSPNNLPRPLTSFIGREREIAEVRRRLAPPPGEAGAAVGCLTLIGPGGTGKTRLALQAAAGLLGAFPDGMWLVELAPLADPDLVLRTITTTLGLREERERPSLQVVTDFLQGRCALLILDNCEHLADAVAQLAETLLLACPHLQLLVSSREALGLAGEVVMKVPPLARPDPRQSLPVEALTQYEAVQLFVERASAALPGFTLTDSNGPAVAQVCYRLDGIPLALELAAARLTLLRVEQIATRLDDRFRLLTGGRRTALPRQQTLRALIDWSYDLLAESERRLFQRLCVFAGGWTLEAAEAICAGDGLDGYDVLDRLTQLINKSLVVAEREPGADTRYRLLETIRQYARDKLLEAGDGSPVRDRHLAYFMGLAEQAEPELRRAQQYTWLKRLDDETDNFRAALEWALEGTVDAGVRLASALCRFYVLQGYSAEGYERLLQLLARPEAGSPTALRARGLRAAARLIISQGDVARGGPRALAEEAFHIYRRLADEAGEAMCLHQMGIAALFVNEIEPGQAMVQESITLYRRVQDQVGLSDILMEWVGYPGNKDFGLARACLEEALTLCRERGDAFSMGFALEQLSTLAVRQGDFVLAHAYLQEMGTLQGTPRTLAQFGLAHNLGELALYEGQYAQAQTYLEASLRESQQGQFKFHAAWDISKLGYVALRQGDEEQAWVRFKECLSFFQAIGNEIGVVFAVEGLASLRTRQGQLARAAALFAWADSVRETVHDARPPVEQAEVNRDLGAIQAHLDEAALSAAAARGRAMTLEQAVETALGDTA